MFVLDNGSNRGADKACLLLFNGVPPVLKCSVVCSHVSFFMLESVDVATCSNDCRIRVYWVITTYFNML